MLGLLSGGRSRDLLLSIVALIHNRVQLSRIFRVGFRLLAYTCVSLGGKVLHHGFILNRSVIPLHHGTLAEGTSLNLNVS